MNFLNRHFPFFILIGFHFKNRVGFFVGFVTRGQITRHYLSRQYLQIGTHRGINVNPPIIPICYILCILSDWSISD